MEKTGNKKTYNMNKHDKNSYKLILKDYFECSSTIQLKEKEKVFYSIQMDEEFLLEFQIQLDNLLKKPNAHEKYFIISQALDRKKNIGNMFQIHIDLIIKYSVKLLQQWLNNTNAFSQKCLQTIIRVILQLMQAKHEKHNVEFFFNVHDILDLKLLLLRLIENKNCNLDCVMLAGTCLFRLLCLTMSIEEIHKEFFYLLQQSENISLSVEKQVKLTHHEDDGHEQNQQVIKLAVINGLLNSNYWELLLIKTEKKPLILLILSDICSLCEDKQYSFYAFQILLAWLRTFQKLYEQLPCDNTESYIPSEKHFTCSIQSLYSIFDLAEGQKKINFINVDPYFCKRSIVFSCVWNLLIVNWENNINGVHDLVSQCFTTLLELHFQEGSLLNYKDSTIADLISYEMKLSWSKKSKYPPLSALINYFGVEKFLDLYPYFPMEFVESLVSNPTASAGMDLYRTILLVKMKETSDDEKAMMNWWNQIWLPCFLEALNKPDNIVHQNLLRYWFPCTLKVIPSAYFHMLNALSINHSTTYKNALVTVVKIARTLGIVNLNVMDLNPIKEALYHLDDMVRIQAFAVLCLNNKKSEPLTLTELKLIEEFILLNLNIDNAPFRQHLITHLKMVLIRLRDCGINSLASTSDSCNVNDEFTESLKFIDRLFKSVISSLFPGSCYQRRRTCLDIIAVIFEVFLSESPMSKKRNVPRNTSKLVEFAQKTGLWHFTDDNIFQSLLCCLQDFMSETKETTVQILENYFSWDKMCIKRELFEKYAYSWACSPKPYVCESGALLYMLIFKKIILPSKDYNQIEIFLKLLLCNLRKHFELAKINIFDASKNSPMHGLVLTLKLCMTEEFCSQVKKEYLSVLVSDALKLMTEISDFILGVLASKINTRNQMPSFADMSEAIEEILDDTGIELNENNPALSAEYQLILSCCWVNLKECSFSVAKLISVCIQSSEFKSDVLFLQQIRQAGDLLFNIMMKCRHKGVIEACQLALGQFSVSLLTHANAEYHKIPFDMLANVLQIIETTATSSVTRRSAGLPLLVLAIVANESSSHNRPLLHYALDKLLHIANLPVPEDHLETEDIHQAHALHILKTLVHDAHLAQSFHCYLTSLIELCIKNFISTSWCIRNASLQLYGSLLPRLLGQKKVRDDNSQHNSLTADIFFKHHPKLADVLLKYLKTALITQHSTHPSLIPILMLLAKLAPGYIDSENKGLLNNYCEVLHNCLCSPIIAVRYLAANAIVALSPLDSCSLLISTLHKLKNWTSLKTNEIHGLLLIVKRLLLFFHSSNVDFSQEQIKELSLALQESLHIRSHPSLIVRILFLKIIQDLSHNLKEEMLDMKSSFLSPSPCEELKPWEPGIAEWNQLLIEIRFNVTGEQDMVSMVQDCLNGKERNQDKMYGCLNYLSQYVRKPMSQSINLHLQEQLLIFICNYPHPFHIEMSFELLIQLFEKEEPHLYHKLILESDTMCFFQKAMTGIYGISTAAMTTVILAHSIKAMLTFHKSLENSFDVISQWSIHIRSYCDPLQTEDLRIKAAKAFDVACPILFTKFRVTPQFHSHDIVSSIFDSAIDLLTDENFEVRQIITKFISILPRTNLPFHPYKSITANYAHQILNAFFVEQFGNNLWFIQFLWDKLKISEDLENNWKCKNYCEKNLLLFDQEDINIYAEQSEVVKLYTKSLLDALRMTEINNGALEQWFEENSYTTIEQSSCAVKFLQDEISKSEMWCFSNIIQNKMNLNILKVCCQVKVLLTLSKQLQSAKKMEWEQIYNNLTMINFDIFGYCLV